MFTRAVALKRAVESIDPHGFEMASLLQDSVADLIEKETNLPGDANTDGQRGAPHDEHSGRRMRFIAPFRCNLYNEFASLVADIAPSVRARSTVPLETLAIRAISLILILFIGKP